MDRYLLEQRLAEHRQAAMRAGIEQAVDELYAADPVAKRNVDRELYRRYVWAGLHTA